MRAHPFPLLAITPCERPDLSLARAFDRHGAAVAVDLGRNRSRHTQVLDALGLLCARSPAGNLGIRVPDQVEMAPAEAPAGVGFVILGEPHHVQRWREIFPVIVQVTCEAEARAAIAAGAAGLIAKGEETGGRVGQGSAFILLPKRTASAWEQAAKV
jgi:NAD(P)H-dependent flavin oxidoreductase YrpB (nitropropane dioxygenase family)